MAEQKRIEITYRGNKIWYDEKEEKWATPSDRHGDKYPTYEKNLATLKSKIDRKFRKPLTPFPVWINPPKTHDSWYNNDDKYVRGKVTQIGVDGDFFITLDTGGRLRVGGYHIFTDSKTNVQKMKQLMEVATKITKLKSLQNKLKRSITHVNTDKIKNDILGKEEEK